MDEMNQYEVIKMTIEEFSRLQNYMLIADKESEVYKMMKDRYTELKIMLSVFSVNVIALDKIKE